MKYLALAFLTILLVTGWLGWQNRAHPKIVNVYVAAGVGALGALLTLLFSLSSESRHVEFPSVFVYNKKTKLPFDPPDCPPVRLFTERLGEAIVVGEALRAYPDLARDPDIEAGQRLYHEVCFRLVLDVLARTFGVGWEPAVRRFDLPTGRHTSAQGNQPGQARSLVTYEDLAENFPDLRLLRGVLPGFPKIQLPPGTVISGATDERSRTLKLRNPFADVSVRVTWYSGSIGLGSLGQMTGLSAEAGRAYWSATYLVSVTAAFPKLRSGHPDMPRYRSWVDLVIEELRAQLDSEYLWEKTQQAYLLARVGGPGGPTAPSCSPPPRWPPLS